MTRRSGRWDLLGEPGDPVPTDDCDVAAVARGFDRTADEIALLAGRLERLSRLDGWTGKAAEEFADSAEDRSRDLQKVQRRYEALAEALKDWKGPVSTVRADSQSALTKATQADQVRAANTTSLLTGVAEPTDAQQAADDRRRDRLQDAQDDIRAAQADLDRALGAFDRAAERTADRIEDASGLYKDGWRDNAAGFVRDHVDVIKGIVNALKWVTLALAAVILVVALFFTAPVWLLPALLTASVVAGALLLAGDVLLVTSGSGEATWGDVAFDVVGLATAGYGRWAVTGLKGAATAVRTQHATDVLDAAAGSAAAREAASVGGKLVNNASRIQNPLNNLRRWADRELISRATRVADEAAQARDAALRQLDSLSPHALRQLATLDRELATYWQQLRHLRDGASAALNSRLDALAAATIKSVVASHVGLAGEVADKVRPVKRAVDGAVDRVAEGLGDAAWSLTRAGR